MESDGVTVYWRDTGEMTKGNEMANAVTLQTLSLNNARPYVGWQKAFLKQTIFVTA